MKPTPETISKYESFVEKMTGDCQKLNDECHRKVTYLNNQIAQCYSIRDKELTKKQERLKKYEAILATLKASQA
jgi:hypothetical protein